jgi:hypothetical protein
MFELKRWLAKSTTHMNKYFSGLEEASISQYIEKNVLVHD